MHTPNSMLRRPAAGNTVQTIPTVCIVDAQPADYRDWDAPAASNGARMMSATTASEALRLVRDQRVDLWIVNGALPGLSGYELCRMLKIQSPNATIAIVTDEYSTDRERQAWAAGAALYACKPGHSELFTHWLSTHTRKSQI